MPVKEIMAIAFMIVGVWYAEGGQKSVQRKIRLVQIQVLHNLGRTSNWGNPSIFKNSHLNQERHAIQKSNK